MKTMIAAAVLLAVLGTGAAQALTIAIHTNPPHRHRQCVWQHQHQVCRWVTSAPTR